MTASNTQNSISTLNSLDYIIDDDETNFMENSTNYNDHKFINKSATSASISTITESLTEDTLDDIKAKEEK